MKKILCPTDFSETSINAIAYAAKLAQVTQADLTLLNIQSRFDFTPVDLLTGKQASVQQAAESLEAKSLEVSKTFKISCYAEVESSHRKLSTVIHEKAVQFDLIVMGSNGPDDLYQFFTGSNTHNTILKTNTPLLLIPNGFIYSEIKSVVYAFDYLRERKLPLTDLIPFIKVLNCNLVVLQVMEEAYSKYAEDDLKDLQYIIQSYHTEVNYEFATIRSAQIPQSLDSYVLRNKADVLALCSTHRNMIEHIFHKSIIQNVANLCNYPLYIFHK